MAYMPVLQENKPVIACIEDQQVIDKILTHLKKRTGYHHLRMLCQKPEPLRIQPYSANIRILE